jgi:hypothetical protein
MVEGSLQAQENEHRLWVEDEALNRLSAVGAA